MKVLFISDLQAAGGAAIACQRMIQNLISQKDISVMHCVRYKALDEKTHSVVELSNHLRLQSIANRIDFWSPNTAAAIRRKGLARIIDKKIRTFSPDIINIHNIHGAKDWDIDIVDLCAQHRPVIWTLHDMWSFTGSCAYTGNCKQYASECNAECTCPNEPPKRPPEQIASSWSKKKALFDKYPHLTAICPSQWLANCAKQGLWQNHRVEVIPCNINLDVFKPVDKNKVRKELKIPSKSPVILTIAESLADKRKGIHLLHEALKLYTPSEAILITVGRNAFDWQIKGLPIHHLGYVSNDHTRAQVYQAADVLIHPALEDNLPNTISEASACGTPTIAFATGGIPEMVMDGATGWLAPELTAKSLAATLKRSLKDIHPLSSHASRCRAHAEKRYDSALHAEKYIELFNEVINGTRLTDA